MWVVDCERESSYERNSTHQGGVLEFDGPKTANTVAGVCRCNGHASKEISSQIIKGLKEKIDPGGGGVKENVRMQIGLRNIKIFWRACASVHLCICAGMVT